ncbi:hypothetical protein CIY_01330 [Butyrivibrio fibrisolvens 16/4]|nr:hypothetical protein CIY_01330 [Butyrivibrio fibrisolvens 16/4]
MAPKGQISKYLLKMVHISKPILWARIS